MGFELTSRAFRGDQPIPKEHTCDGEDISVPLAWKDSPSQTQSFALVVEDPDAPGKTFVHWVLFDLPGDVSELRAGIGRHESLPGNATQGVNDFGNLGYNGPCPPKGPAHHYHFKLYALDRPTGLPPKATRQSVLAAIKGHVLAEAELIGTFKR